MSDKMSDGNAAKRRWMRENRKVQIIVYADEALARRFRELVKAMSVSQSATLVGAMEKFVAEASAAEVAEKE